VCCVRVAGCHCDVLLGWLVCRFASLLVSSRLRCIVAIAVPPYVCSAVSIV